MMNAMTNHFIVAIYRLLPSWCTQFIVRLLKPTFPIGVAVVVIDDEKRVLILEHTYNSPAWRLPGGLLERRESHFQTAVREVLEEANCFIEPIAVVGAANLGKSFDVAVLAKLKIQEPFVANAEIRDFQWIEAAKIDMLPLAQQEFVQEALRFFSLF